MDLHWLVEPGFFSNATVRTAALVGGVVGFTSAVVGTFTVLRRQSFVGEALGDVGATGGSGAYLVNVNPLWGLRRGRAGRRRDHLGDRDRTRAPPATWRRALCWARSLGLAAFFLYFDTTHTSTTGASITVLFGSLFVIGAPPSRPCSPCPRGPGTVALLYRLLLLTTLSPDLAAARGVPVRRSRRRARLGDGAGRVVGRPHHRGRPEHGALLIGPPATALRLVKRPGLATIAAGVIGVVATWLGILLAYDSYDWPPKTHGWPVSFLIVAVVFVLYLAATALPLDATAGGRTPSRGRCPTTGRRWRPWRPVGSGDVLGLHAQHLGGRQHGGGGGRGHRLLRRPARVRFRGPRPPPGCLRRGGRCRPPRAQHHLGARGLLGAGGARDRLARPARPDTTWPPPWPWWSCWAWGRCS